MVSKRDQRDPGFYSVEDGVRIKVERVRPLPEEKVNEKKMYPVGVRLRQFISCISSKLAML